MEQLQGSGHERRAGVEIVRAFVAAASAGVVANTFVMAELIFSAITSLDGYIEDEGSVTAFAAQRGDVGTEQRLAGSSRAPARLDRRRTCSFACLGSIP
jgi:hypothetical protein